MSLLCRIKQSKLNPFSLHFIRCYSQIPIPSLPNHKASKGFTDCCYNYMIRSKIVSINPRPVTAFGNDARFFAAPIEFLKKVEVKEPKKFRLNEQIKAEIVRLVTDEGHDVVSRHEALQRAKRLKLDLVEVDRNAKPPVCKIMDYHKERYKKQLSMKERAKIKSQGSLKKGDCKEVKFSAKTELKDLQIKADMAKKLMERGYRVKLMALSAEDQDLSGLISQLLAMVEDVSFVETGPKFERKQAYFIVRHIKFGPSKKGVKKTSQANGATSSRTQEASTTSADREEETCAEDSGMDDGDDEEDALSQGEDDNTWSVSDSKHDSGKMFDLNRDMKGTFSPAPNKAPGFSHSRPPNFRPPNVEPSSQETENRYARNPKNNASTARDSTNRFPNYGNEAFASRNSRVPPNEAPPLARGESRQFDPRSNFSGRSSQATGFGIFSAPKTEAYGKHESRVEDSQSGRGSPPYNVRRNLGSPINPATVKSNGSQGSGAPDSGKFGIFSKESSDSSPGRGRSFHSK